MRKISVEWSFITTEYPIRVINCYPDVDLPLSPGWVAPSRTLGISRSPMFSRRDRSIGVGRPSCRDNGRRSGRLIVACLRGQSIYYILGAVGLRRRVNIHERHNGARRSVIVLLWLYVDRLYFSISATKQ